MIVNDWHNVYHYSGGFSAFGRCLSGEWQIRRGLALPPPDPLPTVDCVTFSVTPKMTALWSRLIEDAISTRPLRILIGDCSGSQNCYLSNTSTLHILPMLNRHHGEKLDIFTRKVCQAKYIAVTDDDIFWLDVVPWQWASDVLESDPQVAVVSLLPKNKNSSVLQGKVPLPMGSCFVIRREIWLKEKLSYRVDYSPLQQGYDWIYDTGERAQVELYQRGYKIIIAPEDIQSHLIGFEGISSWALKIRKNAGNIRNNIIVDRSVRPEKALRVILALRGMADLFSELYPKHSDPHLVSPVFLDTAETACLQELSPSRVELVNTEISMQINRLRQRLLIMDRGIAISAAIAVPRYKPQLTPNEQISLHHLKHYLGNYPIYWISPDGLAFDRDGYEISVFDKTYFTSVNSYSRLLLSNLFYQAYQNYQYILIYQLDCLVFSDQLEEWCQKGYDYVGAPLFSDKERPEKGFSRTGNGGLSLRKVSSFLRVLESTRYRAERVPYWRDLLEIPLPDLRMMPPVQRLWKRLRVLRDARRGVAWYASSYTLNEDLFWSDRARLFDPDFRIAPVEDALKFAFEKYPRYCFEKNGRQLPFGCHAWAKHDRAFWEPYILK